MSKTKRDLLLDEIANEEAFYTACPETPLTFEAMQGRTSEAALRCRIPEDAPYDLLAMAREQVFDHLQFVMIEGIRQPGEREESALWVHKEIDRCCKRLHDLGDALIAENNEELYRPNRAAVRRPKEYVN